MCRSRSAAGMRATQQAEQAVFIGTNAVDRNRIEIAVHASIDHAALLFHLQRRELRLLQKLGEAGRHG